MGSLRKAACAARACLPQWSSPCLDERTAADVVSAGFSGALTASDGVLMGPVGWMGEPGARGP